MRSLALIVTKGDTTRPPGSGPRCSCSRCSCFRRYPDISVELLTSSTPTSLIEDGVDIALLGGELSDSSLIAKKIAETSIVTVATPQYLAKHGPPEHPDDLTHHLGVIFIQYGTPRDWIFEDESGRFVCQPRGSLRTNDAEQMRIAVLSHLGIANAPAWLFARELASGEVCPLLTRFAQPTKPIFALRRSGRRLTARVVSCRPPQSNRRNYA